MSEQAVSDPHQFARGRNSLEGSIALTSLHRLQDSLAVCEGGLHYRLTGFLDEHGQPGLHCQVQGVLQLTCQRCLEPMPFALNVDAYLLYETQMAEQLAEDCEAPDRIKVYPDMPVAAIVEEEILLALPMAARHEQQCQAPQQMRDKPQPFAVLAQLKTETER